MKNRRLESQRSCESRHLHRQKASPAITGLLAAIVAISSSHAATQTWDGAASGVWDTSALNWDGGAAAWTSSNDALFSGTPANNVTTATGLTIGTITLDNTFTGSVAMTGTNTVSGATTISGGTLNLNAAAGLGASAITVNSGGTLAINPGTATSTVSNNISGAGLVTAQDPAGAGGNTLNLGGDYSGFTGTLNILAGASNFGKVNFSGTTQAGVISSSATIQVQSGATLYLNKALSYGASIELFGSSNSENLGALRLETNANVTGSVTLKANSFIGVNGGSDGTISGVIGENGGSFGFTKVGNRMLTLSGNNTFTGTVTLNAGTLSVGSDTAGAYNLGGSGTNAIVFNGGTLQVTGTSMTSLGSHTPTFNSNVAVGFDIANAANTFAVSVNLANTTGSNSSFSKLGAGKLTLSGTNAFGTSLTASAGTLEITGTTTIDGGTVANRGFLTITGNTGVTVSSGGSLSFLGTTNATKPGSIIAQNVAGTSTLLVDGGSFTVGSETGFILGNGNNNNVAANGVLTISSGTATINRGTTATTTNGADTRLIMMGRDSTSATGTINLNGGTLATSRQFVRDGSSTGQSGTANFVFNGGTLKALANQTDWLQSTTATSEGQNIGASGGTVNTNALALSSVTVTAASTIDSNGFSVAVNNNISGSGGFTVISSSGTGTVTFGGANTYTGATAVNSGTLALTSTGSISSSASVSLAAGATLNTAAQTTFTMLSAQPFTFTLDPSGAGSAGLLAAAGLDITNGAVTFSTLGTLNDTAYVIASYSSLTGSAFSSVTSLPSGYTLNYNYLGSNVIALVVVPEPHEYAVAIAALLGVMIVIRRRRQNLA